MISKILRQNLILCYAKNDFSETWISELCETINVGAIADKIYDK